LDRIIFIYLIIKRALYDYAFLPTVCRIRALCYLLLFRVQQKLGMDRAVLSLLASHQAILNSTRFAASNSRLVAGIESKIAAVLKEKPFSCRHAGIARPSRQDLRILHTRGGIVLKNPVLINGRVAEKGVLLLKHGRNFRLFIQAVDLPALLQQFSLVLEPGWPHTAACAILFFANYPDSTVLVMAPERRNYAFLQKLETNICPLRIGSGDWVHPDVFKPITGLEKKFDVIMVARWRLVKRHHALFRAIHRMGDASCKLALVSLVSSGRREIERLLEGYGIRDQATLYEQISQHRLNKIFNQSKVHICVSRIEGSNKSITEGFLAGTPCIVLDNMVGCRPSRFTAKTGMIIPEERLPSAIGHFRKYWKNYSPRSWALRHVDPAVTTARLNDAMKKQARRENRPWTVDLAPKYNGPELSRYPRSDAHKNLVTMKEVVERYRRGNTG